MSLPSFQPNGRTPSLIRASACILVLLIIVLGVRSSRRESQHPEPPVQVSGDTVRLNVGPRMILGTFVRISAVAEAKQKDMAEKAIDKAFGRIEEIDRLMSGYKPDSEVSRFNAGPANGGVMSEDTFAVLKKAQEVSDLTAGAFDITVPPLMRLWKEAAKRDSLPTDQEMKDALALVSYRNLSLNETTREATSQKNGVMLDLGGIAKGYSVDAAAKTLRENGLKNFMVEAGGEVYCEGKRDETTPWRIGVQDPRSEPGDQKLLDTILGLSDIAVATSGNYQQFVTIGGKRFSHIVDPRTGHPADDVPGATIIAPDCMTADALATAVSVMGVDKGLSLIESLPGTEALLITVRNGSLESHKSKGFDKFIVK